MSGALEMGQFYWKLVLTLLPSVCTLCLRLLCGKGSALGEGVKSPLSEPEGNSLGTLYLCMQIRGPFQTFHLSGKPQTQTTGTTTYTQCLHPTQKAAWLSPLTELNQNLCLGCWVLRFRWNPHAASGIRKGGNIWQLSVAVWLISALGACE